MGWRVACAVCLVALAALGGAASAGSAVPTSFANAAAIAVPSVGTGTPFPSSIEVSGLSGQVVKVTVTLIELHHTRPVDLDILLVGPGGHAVLLLSDCCHAAPIAGVTVTFDDFGRRLAPGAPIPSAPVKPANVDVTSDAFPAPAPPGTYATRLSVFNGTDPNGTWRLFVHDDEGEHAGGIVGGWVLTIHTRTVAGETNLIARGAPR